VALREGILTFSQYLDDDRERIRSRTKLVNQNPSLMGRLLMVQGEWADNLAGALAERSGDPGPSFEQRVLASAAIGALSTAVLTWTTEDGSLLDLTRRALEILSTALG
jgi:hypothetical protein